MQTVSNYDGIITIPSKMNDLEEWEVSLMFPEKKNIPNLPIGIDKNNPFNSYQVRYFRDGKREYIGSRNNTTDAIILLEQYCTEHKLKLF